MMGSMTADGRQRVENYLSDTEKLLAENDMPAKVISEVQYKYRVSAGGKDYSIVKYLLNREYFSFQKRTFFFQKRTFFLDKQDQVQSEEKYNQEIEKFLDILFNFDFRGSICRQNVGGYEIDESCQRVVFSLVSMISEYSEFAN